MSPTVPPRASKAAKPAAKPAAKTAAKPAAKPTAKPVAKSAATSATRTTAKSPAKAAKPVAPAPVEIAEIHHGRIIAVMAPAFEAPIYRKPDPNRPKTSVGKRVIVK